MEEEWMGEWLERRLSEETEGEERGEAVAGM